MAEGYVQIHDSLCILLGRAAKGQPACQAGPRPRPLDIGVCMHVSECNLIRSTYP